MCHRSIRFTVSVMYQSLFTMLRRLKLKYGRVREGKRSELGNIPARTAKSNNLSVLRNERSEKKSNRRKNTCTGISDEFYMYINTFFHMPLLWSRRGLAIIRITCQLLFFYPSVCSGRSGTAAAIFCLLFQTLFSS